MSKLVIFAYFKGDFPPFFLAVRRVFIAYIAVKAVGQQNYRGLVIVFVCSKAPELIISVPAAIFSRIPLYGREFSTSR